MLKGKFMGCGEEVNTFVLERKFVVNELGAAVLRATALGLYTAYLNGRRVGDAYLTPGWTSYHNTLQVQEYDVSALLKKGENVISFVVGEGWYKGPLFWLMKRNCYGNKTAVCADLLFGDTVLSTDESFSARTSRIKESGIYAGESVDLTAEPTPLTPVEIPFDHSDGVLREVYPKFTFFGFRYMCVEGLDTVDPADFTGNVLYSDLDETVFASTGESKMDRLLLNCKWGQKSNFVDIPTDCPQRDERLGWTGDAEVFCPAACYQFDCRAFYNKYCRDMAIDQRRLNGGIASYSPSFGECEESGSVWSDAATIIPWTVYEFYGDKYILLEHLPLMRAYVDALIRKDEEHGGERLLRFGFCLGDWLSQDGVNSSAFRGATNEHLIASCYYFNSVKLLAKAERALGDEARAERYFGIAEEIRHAILREYFTATGRLAVDTQTAYVLCIMFGIWVEREKLVSSFEKRMKKDEFAIKGGFVGATKLIQALLRAGLTEDAFRILYSEKFPSWLYCVNLGATTIWERWNSLAADGSITGTAMNSLNHYSFGAVAEAFYRDIAGIIPTAVAFKKVTISPKFNHRLIVFSCRFLSPAGEFRVNYRILPDGKVRLNVTIPYGVEAELDVMGKRTSLPAGESVVCLPADRKLVYPFSLDSLLCDVLDNEKARAAFREVAPGLCAYFSSYDVGMGGYTMRSLLSMRSFFVPPQMQEVLDGKLQSVAT